MEETKQCPICFKTFPTPVKFPNQVYCSRRCAATGNSRNSSVTRVKFKCEWELFQEAELLFGQREGRIPYIAGKLGCSEPTVHNVKRRMRYKWKEETPVRTFTTTHAARAYIKQYGKCAVCAESRFLEAAHWWPAKSGGSGDPENIIPLCANHHRYYDRNMLNPDELKNLETFLRAKHPDLFERPELIRQTLQKARPEGGRMKVEQLHCVSS